ncbi:MAG: endolytic transglycosylase MltG [Candidatus Cryosericum sp.]
MPDIAEGSASTRLTLTGWLRGLTSAAGIVGIIVSLMMVVGSAGWVRLVQIVQPGADATIDIRPGDSVVQLSERVFEAGITSSPQSLRRFWQLQRGGALREGRYALAGVTNMEGLYELFAKGSPLTVRVTIPEGYTVRQIAARLEGQAGIASDAFLEAAVGNDGKLLEGRLFPDTYDVLYAGDAAVVVARMLGRFADVLPSDWVAAAKQRGLTGSQLVIVASIVEREVKYDADRPIVASVIYNRLKAGMLLQMDATLGYVLPSHDGFYTYAELKDPSPYNTYVHAGLPPSPICNPGLASLDAAAHAPASDYYYFLAKSDGHCVFARTFAEHERNIRLYLSGGN